ncbi:MAG: hypothetical protein PUC65_15765 [Clostridiales bacterium]|nr:hypothetical protein [Clostridiales bacterium]
MEERRFLKKRPQKNSILQQNTESVTIDFRSAFRGRKVPLVTLDERWLTLFPPEDMNERMKELQHRLNELLKHQGRAVENIKGYKRFKSQLMQEIVDNMEVDESPIGKLKQKKLEKNQKKILDINEQLQQSEEELSDLPYEIKDTNEELLAETSKVGLLRLLDTGRKLNGIKSEILELEQQLVELKREQRELEKVNRDTYLYMNDMLGTDMMKKIDDAMEE